MEQTRAEKLTAKSEPPMAPFTVPMFQPQPALPHLRSVQKRKWLQNATQQQIAVYKAKKPELKAKKAEYDKARYLAKKAAKKATPKDAPKDKVEKVAS